MIFVGVDWAEAHHDVYVENEDGKRLGGGRLPEGVDGIARFHELVGSHVEEPAEVVSGIETDRGLFVAALVAAGYEVYAVNPMSTSRYRDRHSVSGAKSDPGDAKVLADMVRTDRHNHRMIAGDSDGVEAVKVLARAHQRMAWSRGRQTNLLRSTLREFYPAALAAFDDLASGDALEMLRIAPTPTLGAGPSRSKIAAALRRGGRQRRVDERSVEIQTALRTEQLQGPAVVATAMGASVAARVAVIAEMTAQIALLAGELEAGFEQHPDAAVVRSLPGLGTILGARVLGEFGDEPNRYATAKCRKNYAGTSPITRASGTKRVVLARHVRNQRLADAVYLWAFAALHRVTRRPSLLRHPASRRRRPPPSTTRPRQPPRRHPPRVSRPPHRLRRNHRLGTPHGSRHQRCRLTVRTVGCLVAFAVWVAEPHSQGLVARHGQVVISTPTAWATGGPDIGCVWWCLNRDDERVARAKLGPITIRLVLPPVSDRIDGDDVSLREFGCRAGQGVGVQRALVADVGAEQPSRLTDRTDLRRRSAKASP